MWLKIKVWTKTIVASVLLIYALLFILQNSGQSVKFWYWFRREYETSMLVLIVITFLAGVVGTILVRTTFTTMRQIRELRDRSRTEKMERDLADMKSKAAMLQTRTRPTTAPAVAMPPPQELPED